MSPATNEQINVSKLSQYASFLRNDCKKITDALFVENLIDAIQKHPATTKNIVDRWLLAAFEFKVNYNDNNCIDTYNMSFYHQIMNNI